MYQSNSKNAFQLEHCWKILMNETKWLILRDNLKVRTRQPATQDNLYCLMPISCILCDHLYPFISVIENCVLKVTIDNMLDR